MNTLSLLTISFFASLVAPIMIGTHQKASRMGLAAIVWLLFACTGIYAGGNVLMQCFQQVPLGLWLIYTILPVYFVAVAGYWLYSLYSTWQKWGMLWDTIRVWRSAPGYSRDKALYNILGALRSQGHSVPRWTALCLFWLSPRRAPGTKR